MSYAEALQWQAFLEKRGTVHLGMRLEAGFALIATAIIRSWSNSKAKIEDFMPHAKDPDGASIEDAMKELLGAVNPKGTKPPKKVKGKK